MNKAQQLLACIEGLYGAPESPLDPNELSKGVRHELKTINSWKIANEIAKKKLTDDPYCYSRISEKFLTALKDSGNYVEIFENPNRRELSSLGDDIRFIVDTAGQRVIVWDAELLIHIDAAHKLQISLKNPNYIAGSMEKVGTVYHIANIETMYAPGVANTLRKNDYSWVDMYGIPLQDYINTTFGIQFVRPVKEKPTVDALIAGLSPESQKRLAALRKFR